MFDSESAKAAQAKRKTKRIPEGFKDKELARLAQQKSVQSRLRNAKDKNKTLRPPIQPVDKAS